MWKKRNVLVTGSNGFVGSHLCERLIHLEAKVVGLYRELKEDSVLVKSGSTLSMTMIKGDLTDLFLLKEVIETYEIETIFHLGAQTDVKVGSENPIETFESNIRGTWNVLEASKRSDKVKQIIVASSDKAYGTTLKLPYSEENHLNGIFPYDVSKSATDMLSSTYFHTFNSPVCITRCGNIYGEGDLNLTRIVPSSIMSIIKGEIPLIRGNGQSTRDYLYILDAVEAYLNLAENMERNPSILGEAFNFSNEDPITVIELVNKIIKISGKEGITPTVLNVAKHEIDHQFLNSLKATEILNWKPKFSLDTGILNTIKWY
ncbi:sugar dehydratase, partial (plasmid) [Planococcus sp. MB-3u-03]